MKSMRITIAHVSRVHRRRDLVGGEREHLHHVIGEERGPEHVLVDRLEREVACVGVHLPVVAEMRERALDRLAEHRERDEVGVEQLGGAVGEVAGDDLDLLLALLPAGEELAHRDLRRDREDVAVGRVGIQLLRPGSGASAARGARCRRPSARARRRTGADPQCERYLLPTWLNDRSRRRASAARSAARAGPRPRAACGVRAASSNDVPNVNGCETGGAGLHGDRAADAERLRRGRAAASRPIGAGHTTRTPVVRRVARVRAGACRWPARSGSSRPGAGMRPDLAPSSSQPTVTSAAKLGVGCSERGTDARRVAARGSAPITRRCSR